jgi:hypothetical protein
MELKAALLAIALGGFVIANSSKFTHENQLQKAALLCISMISAIAALAV